MKLMLLVLLNFSLSANGQRKVDSIDETLRKGDSLEILYKNDKLLNTITDTLPLETLDETSGWRDMQLVSYFYDTLNTLRKISFRNGRDGYYFFYFDGNYLRKARVLKKGSLINLQYYFTIEDNMISPSDIDRKVSQNPGTKDLYELFKMGKAFREKFNTLLLLNK